MKSNGIRERLIKALTARGERIVPTNSKRYITMTRQKGGYYFIGKTGILRAGSSPGHSFPVENTGRKLLDELDQRDGRI
jgi:hypothetical protein